MEGAFHDPEIVATELATKLSARSRHVCVFLGAGASRSAGLPDLAGLQRSVLNSLAGPEHVAAERLFATKNLEAALSYLRRVAAILEAEDSLRGLTAADAAALNRSITQAIIPALDHATADTAPFENLAVWASGEYYRLPVEIFTINYDLLIENGLECLSVPYFDGFVGNLRGRFCPELIDAVDPQAPGALPASYVRLWKIHGSVNWTEASPDGSPREVVRLGVPAPAHAVAAIYPSDEKYDQSRRVPFVVLIDRFRRAIEMPETLTIVTGYSFGDQHLNELMFDACRRHPRSETVVFCFDVIPDSLAAVATRTRNLSVLGATEACVGGSRCPWAQRGDIPGVWEGSRFLLGDFARLSNFLATRTRIGGDAP